MKHVTLNLDPERLKSDPELETAFLKIFGREQLNEKVYSENSEDSYDLTTSEIAAMSESEFEERHDEIMEAMSKNRILKDN